MSKNNKNGDKGIEHKKDATPQGAKTDPPPHGEDIPSKTTPIMPQVAPVTLDGQKILGYLEGIELQFKAMNARLAKVEHNSIKNAKRKARRLKGTKDKKDKTSKKLILEFDEVADGMKKTGSLETDEISPSQEERGSHASSEPRHEPASSEARSTSVLDRIGKKITEHDLRLRLEKSKSRRERTPPRTERRERTPPRTERRERTPPRKERMEKTPPRTHRRERRERTSSHHSNEERSDERIGDLRVGDLRRLLVQMENKKRAPPPATAPSPFTPAIRMSPLPPAFRSNLELAFNGDADPAEYLARFNTEMEVYQVPDLTRCRLFTASLRGSAQRWFTKLGPANISTWRQLGDLFLRQFQSTLHYAPPGGHPCKH
ncbi:hypothetical protein POM88_004156 [Heracleum sosnowskyi]|uniref:Retrotransposon gag domain-containing protein n=1 Tax=Heracleum sosnowskyi TaxID=360622 RepID=A0AAD8NDR6_9APIA|nr:hypothetical protein POM88_004156 [Heracleum sosnowskyi]